MSKIMNRIFKNKRASKTLDDIQSPSSPTKVEAVKHATLPRSKTTQLNGVNGRTSIAAVVSLPQSNGYHMNGNAPGAAKQLSSKGITKIRSPPSDRSQNGDCLSPVEIPVEEALQLIAEDPPHVARSTPKNLVIDTSHWKEEHDMQHCIFERGVYEKMIDNSLKTCELLQSHLDNYITVVRQTPSRDVTPVKKA